MLSATTISPGGVRMGMIHILAAQAVLRKNDVATWVVEADLSDPVAAQVQEGSNLVLDDGYTRVSGPVTSISTEVEAAQRTLILSGVGELQHLKDRLVYPNPALPITAQDRSHYTASGPAASVLHTLVEVSVGRGALPERKLSYFQVDNAPGGTKPVKVSERLSNLLEAAQSIAEGGDLIFDAVRMDSGSVQFSSRLPKDLSRSCRFEATGTFAYQAPKATAVIIAQQGEGADRFMQEKTSPTEWGRRVELLKDRRDTDDASIGEAEALKLLAENAQTSSASLTVPADHRKEFGRDFLLGDVVSVSLGTATIAAPVSQVNITWDGYGRQVELTVGAKPPGESTESKITTMYKELAQRLQKLESR